MKLNKRDMLRHFKSPDTSKAGTLIYGPDAMRVALKRQELNASLLGPNAEEEMRLTRLSGGALRSEPALLSDAIKATGFFPGQRVAFVESVTDTVAPIIIEALESWRPGDAHVVVTAGQLKPTSKLRKFFESNTQTYAAAIYDDPPTREEIADDLRTAGLDNLPQDALGALSALAHELEPGDFRQTLEKLALYKLNDSSPVTFQDISMCAPASNEAEMDDVIHAVAEGRFQDIGPILKRLKSQGTNAVGLCIALARHFKTLLLIVGHPNGPSEGVSKLRPPAFGPRRDRLMRQANTWSVGTLKLAVGELTDTDLLLRSANQTAPQMEVLERLMVKLAMMSKRRG